LRILALTRYERLGSSSRVRFYQYVPYLHEHGIEIISKPFFDDQYVRDLYAGQKASLKTLLVAYLKRITALLNRASFDLLWVEMELYPWFPATFEAFLQMSRTPYVVDYDDAVFHRYDLHPQAAVRKFLGHKIDNVMRHANMVIAGNDYLAKRATQAGAKRVEYLPSVVDVSQYALTESEPGSAFRIGWIGAPVTAPYLELVREAIERLGQESEVRLILIGSGQVQPFSNVSMEVLPWTEEIDTRLSHHFDVGIMPLVDGPFERGKCGYKLIQYMAGGLAVIGTPVGVNTTIVEPGVNGYLASSPSDWYTALCELRDDFQKRKMMGQAGRRKAEQMYNLHSTAPKLLNLLSSVSKA
jgi:glycosyltransferase involved in cell wall biosynthesis